MLWLVGESGGEILAALERRKKRERATALLSLKEESCAQQCSAAAVRPVVVDREKTCSRRPRLGDNWMERSAGGREGGREGAAHLSVLGTCAACVAACVNTQLCRFLSQEVGETRA